MCYVGRFMSDEQSDWAQMMRFFIRQQMQRRSYCGEIKYWTAEEGLLLLPSISTPQSETTNNIIHSWFQFKKYLTLDNHALALLDSLMLRQIWEPMGRYRVRRPFNDRIVYPLLKRIDIHVLTNLFGSSGPQRLKNSPSWRWKNSEISWTGGTQPSKLWHKLTEAEETPDDLSDKWPMGSYDLTWSSRWRNYGTVAECLE
ncbi:hypothetical protein R1flu_019397 [Riccia fluitans]|uniref:Maturase K n=1 Tax=Riccia fluitans TaxID=41844 RepID=A0ABD1ZIJ2_9MARC